MSNNICPNCSRNIGMYYGSIEISNECFYCKLEERDQNIFIKLWKKLKSFFTRERKPMPVKKRRE